MKYLQKTYTFNTLIASSMEALNAFTSTKKWTSLGGRLLYFNKYFRANYSSCLLGIIKKNYLN